MNKYEVTFHFENCNPIQQVHATDEDAAIEVARNTLYPPVPLDTPATVRQIVSGGRRPGAGNRAGSVRTDEPRAVRKQIRWTAKEWRQVEQDAVAAGLDVADYQRRRVFGWKP